MGFFSSILETTAQSNTSNVLGVDIGSSAIKVVELEDRNGVIALVTYGEVQLGPYAGKSLGTLTHLSVKQEQEALVDVIRESAVTSRNGVFAMPLSASFISTASMNADSDADLSSMVRVEARKLIPASLSEVTLDWAELETLSKKQTERSVLIAAIQNSAIERFNVLMQFAGFSNAPTEIECFSANRTIGKREHAVVIDIGAASTKMYISHNGVLTRMHRVNTGGAAITHQLVTDLDVEFEEAETLKQTATSQHEQYADVQQAYRSVLGRPMREFKQVIEHYQENSEIEIDYVGICGGASLFAGAVPFVQDRFGLPVQYIDPFRNVAYPAFMEDAMKAIGPSFVPALGAALRNFE